VIEIPHDDASERAPFRLHVTGIAGTGGSGSGGSAGGSGGSGCVAGVGAIGWLFLPLMAFAFRRRRE
jgi:hypothetical protein